MESVDSDDGTRLELGPALFSALIKVLEDPTGNTSHPNISHRGRGATQKIPVVGESFYQDAIRKFKDRIAYGFLVPDQNNAYDKNAVALYLISEDLMIHRVGHLPRDLAAQVSQQIANLLASNDQIIPVRAKIQGGTKEKPTMGVFATTKSDSVQFG
jgi:hypothetical protein